MGVAAKKAGKLAVRIANSIINCIIILLVLLMVAFSCYALWDSNQLHLEAAASQYGIYKPTIKDEGESFAELVKINPEVFSWLTVYGTHIDYPVTQGEDNWRYVNMNPKGEYSMSGSIFLDSGNSPSFTDFNSILYGHHMEKQTMFGELDQFSNKTFFEERPYGNLYYDGQDHGLEFFLFLHVDAYDSTVFTAGMQDGEMQQQYLDNLLEKATLARDINVTIDDRLVLLTTCSQSSTNGRDILVARITQELYDDTFITQEIDNEGNPKVDEQTNWWAKFPLWAWGILLALLACMLVGIVLMNRRNKRKKEQFQLFMENKRRMRAHKAPTQRPSGDKPEKTEEQGE